MKPNDDLRELLRGADPAEGRELPALERARMRAAILRAASTGETSRRAVLVPALGVALVVAAFVLLTVQSTPPVPPGPIATAGPTRIVFTAPEGTRILWFVASSETKEPGS